MVLKTNFSREVESAGRGAGGGQDGGQAEIDGPHLLNMKRV